MEVDGGPVLYVGLLDGEGVIWMVGRAEEENDEVTRGRAEDIREEGAVGDTKEETDEGCDPVVGVVNGEEWDTKLEVGVYSGVEPTALEGAVRGDVMEEDGKDAE